MPSAFMRSSVYRSVSGSTKAVPRSLVERAKANGASALMVTVDVPVLGRREAHVARG